MLRKTFDRLIQFTRQSEKGYNLDLRAKHAYFETVAARLEGLELGKNLSIKITAEKGLSLLLPGE